MTIPTRSQQENMSRGMLIEEVKELKTLKKNINSKLSEFSKRLKDFNAKYEMSNSHLFVSRRSHKLLLKHIVQLDQNLLNKPQYNQRKNVNIILVPSDITKKVLEQSVCHMHRL